VCILLVILMYVYHNARFIECNSLFQLPSTHCFAVLHRCNAHQKLMLTRLLKQQKWLLKVENGVK